MVKYRKVINFTNDDEQPLTTYEEIIYGTNGITIYTKTKQIISIFTKQITSIFIPYTSIHTIETTEEQNNDSSI